MGLEILRHCPAAQRARLHAIFVPVGGGGMAAGIAALVKAADPSILVIGVEPTGAAPTWEDPDPKFQLQHGANFAN